MSCLLTCQELFQKIFSKRLSRSGDCHGCGSRSSMHSYRNVICSPTMLTIRIISPDDAAGFVHPIACPPVLNFGGERFKLLGAINYNRRAAHFSSCVIVNGRLYSAEEGMPSSSEKYLSWKEGYSQGGGWDGLLGKTTRSITKWIFYRWVETITI